MNFPFVVDRVLWLDPDQTKIDAYTIHKLLVRACSNDPYHGNYKAGYFASEVTQSRPLLSCLQVFIDSSKTTAVEKALFQKLKDTLKTKLEREAKNLGTSKHDRLNLVYCADILDAVEIDRKARLDEQARQPSKTFADAFMDDQQTMIPRQTVSAVKQVHVTLVFACRDHPFHKFKEGHFASTILASRPVLSCLQCLNDSSKTTPNEKTVFAAVKKHLVSLVARIANGGTIPTPEIVHTMQKCYKGLENTFEHDRLDQFFKQGPKNIVMVAPESYKGSPTDAPSLLLAFAHEVLLRGIKEATYLNSTLKDDVAINTDVLQGLAFLSVDTVVPHIDRPAFKAAKLFAQRLKDLQLEGTTKSTPPGFLHYQFIRKFDPVIDVFDDDADRRHAQRSIWPTLRIMDNKVGIDAKVIMELGKGRGPPVTTEGERQGYAGELGGS